MASDVERSIWGSDVPVSAPFLPTGHYPQTVRVPFHGLGFEPSGLVFDLDQTVWEDIYLPKYSPEVFLP